MDKCFINNSNCIDKTSKTEKKTIQQIYAGEY